MQILSTELERERERLRQILDQYGVMWGASRSPERYMRSRSPSPIRSPYPVIDSWARNPNYPESNLNDRPYSPTIPPQPSVVQPKILPYYPSSDSATAPSGTKVTSFRPGEAKYLPRKWDDKSIGTSPPGIKRPINNLGDPTEFMLEKIKLWIDNTEQWLLQCPVTSIASDTLNFTPLLKIRDTANVLGKEAEFFSEQRAFLASLPGHSSQLSKQLANTEVRLNKVRNALGDACSLAIQACEVSNANKTSVFLLSDQVNSLALKCREFDKEHSMGDASATSKWLEYLLDSIQTLSIKHRNGKAAVERDLLGFYSRCKQLSDDRSNFAALKRSVTNLKTPSPRSPVPNTLELLVKNTHQGLMDTLEKNEQSVSHIRSRLGTVLSSRISSEQRVVDSWQRICDIELRRQKICSENDDEEDQIKKLKKLKLELSEIVDDEQNADEEPPALLKKSFDKLVTVVGNAIDGDIERLETAGSDTSSSDSTVLDAKQQQWSSLLAQIDSNLEEIDDKLEKFEKAKANDWFEGDIQFEHLKGDLNGAGKRLYDVAALIDSSRHSGDHSVVLRQMNNVERKLTKLWKKFSETVLKKAVKVNDKDDEPELASNLVESSSDAVRGFSSFLVRLIEVNNQTAQRHLCVNSNCCLDDREFDSQLAEAVDDLRKMAQKLEKGDTDKDVVESALQAIANVRASLEMQARRRSNYVDAWKQYVEAEEDLSKRLQKLRSVVDRVMANPPQTPATSLTHQEQLETLTTEASDIANTSNRLGLECRDFFKSGEHSKLFLEADVLYARFGWITVDARQLAERLASGAASAKQNNTKHQVEQREIENFSHQLERVEKMRSSSIDMRPNLGSMKRNLHLEVDYLMDKVRHSFDPELYSLRQAKPSSLSTVENAMGRTSDLEYSSVVAKFALSALNDVLRELDSCRSEISPFSGGDTEKHKVTINLRFITL